MEGVELRETVIEIWQAISTGAIDLDDLMEAMHTLGEGYHDGEDTV